MEGSGQPGEQPASKREKKQEKAKVVSLNSTELFAHLPSYRKVGGEVKSRLLCSCQLQRDRRHLLQGDTLLRVCGELLYTLTSLALVWHGWVLSYTKR